ncbi:arginine deiminase type-3 [Metarhizium album ARSEF 1941]|uniref:Arginine deiminase type-3 n=1 Tax=Metarhizium album (strain ARSEF 1941) TaxID=1081103 RepID=A0A0B2WPC9_METAS|nr:arginine deiminase type-3 [Metarhizium album ARSEF 1941]KHN95514.1 arginine deiminase type-3 [Metarhizium album ARSEF 1941]
MGYRALEMAKEAGHGDVPLTSHATTRRPTVRQFLDEESNKEAAVSGAEHMQQLLSTLKKETGLTDQYVVRVPGVLSPTHWLTYWLGVRLRQDGGPDELYQLNSAFPSQVNAVPLSESRIMVAKPWGPVVDGHDILERMSREAYSKAGFHVDFIDDWPFHLASGDLHCITNAYRTPTARWW